MADRYNFKHRLFAKIIGVFMYWHHVCLPIEILPATIKRTRLSVNLIRIIVSRLGYR